MSELNDWMDCSKILYEKLVRFRDRGYLASHDLSLAMYEQLRDRHLQSTIKEIKTNNIKPIDLIDDDPSQI